MAKANGPFTPKRGWMKRWIIQGAQILSRSPEAILFIAATVLISGYVSLTVLTAFYELTGLKIIGVTVQHIVSTPIALIGALFALNALRKADRGEWSKPEDLLVAGLPAILNVTRFIVFLSLVILVAFVPSELMSAAKEAAAADTPEPSFLVKILTIGAMDVSTAIAMCLFLHPLAMGGVVLRGMDSNMLRANSMALRLRDIRTFMTIAAAVFIGHQLVSLLPKMAGLPLLGLYLAWFYIGSREVFDGDDENGQTEASRKTVLGTG